MSREVIVIGAGIGGLATAARLSHLGHSVHVIETASGPGGKMRTHMGSTGPIDIGPTVLTLLPTFLNLFKALGEDINDYIQLTRQNLLARHWWPDGTSLDLHDSFEATHHDITHVFGSTSATEFTRFYDDTKQLFDCFDKPVMQNARPNLGIMTKAVLSDPDVMVKMRPLASLEKSLNMYFTDPKLRQLFGRYATYVGGMPHSAPALLSLIWQAEANGVWTIKGGMSELAKALEKICIARHARFSYNTRVVELHNSGRQVKGVTLEDGTFLTADTVVFNGDPRALATGMLGKDVTGVAPKTRRINRSLSAYVWGFDARIDAPDLAHHNVFFSETPNSEFTDIENGKMPSDPTLYVCAQDRGKGKSPPDVDRFEIILNAPPLSKRQPEPEDFDRCKATTFDRLQSYGLNFQIDLQREHLTMPQDFETLFPASDGSLYGQSPEGLMATLKRPKCTTPIKNLFLVGGGVHPGAGVPMATLCAQLAVEEITKRQIST